MTPEQMDALKATKEEAKAQCKRLHEDMQFLYKSYKKTEEDYNIWLKRFENADHELALYDGRLTVFPGPGKHKPSHDDVKLTVKLSKEQILRLASELGITCEGEEGEEELDLGIDG